MNMELSKNFCLHADYRSKTDIFFQDTKEKTDEYQDKVYELFRKVINECGIEEPNIADISAGSGYKLEKWFPEFIGERITGYDLAPTVKILKERYPNKTWVVSDFDSSPKKVDLVICADVIEHVLNPDELMQFILKMDPEHLVISTPDRDLLVQLLQRDNNGPSKNPYHVREWSFAEFAEYVTQFFDIVEHVNDPSEYNQYIHCKRKEL